MKKVFSLALVALVMFISGLAAANENKFNIELGVDTIEPIMITNESQLIEHFDEILNSRTISAILWSSADLQKWPNSKDEIKLSLPESKLIQFKGKEYHLKNMVFNLKKGQPSEIKYIAIITGGEELTTDKHITLYLGVEEIEANTPPGYIVFTISHAIWAFPLYARLHLLIQSLVGLGAIYYLIMMIASFSKTTKLSPKKWLVRFVICLITFIALSFALLALVALDGIGC